MAYNTKAILTDLNGKPIPQYFDVVADVYKPLTGAELWEDIETQLAAILAKLIAAPATEAKQDTLNAKDFATQTTLAAILAKLIAAPATEATLAAVKAAVELDSRGLFVNRPTAAAGQFKTYWSIDTGDISVSDGTTWKTIGVI